MGEGAPAWLPVLLGFGLVAVAQTRSRLRGWGVAALLAMTTAAYVVTPATRLPLSAGTVGFVLGCVFLAGAIAIAIWASRLRWLADFLSATEPLRLDDALEDEQQGRHAPLTLLEGRLWADEPATSPGGVVCALYEAEVRTPPDDGRRGALVSSERGAGRHLYLRGDRNVAPLAGVSSGALGAAQPRPCRVWSGALLSGAAPVTGEDPSAIPAVSYERVGRLGESCYVIGRLRPVGPGQRHGIAGPRGGPALLIVGSSLDEAARLFARKAWAFFFAALLLAAGAAYLLAGH